MSTLQSLTLGTCDLTASLRLHRQITMHLPSLDFIDVVQPMCDVFMYNWLISAMQHPCTQTCTYLSHGSCFYVLPRGGRTRSRDDDY